MNQFYILSLLSIGILMAIDGKANIGLCKFCVWQKIIDFGDLCDSATRNSLESTTKTNAKSFHQKIKRFENSYFLTKFRVIYEEIETKDNHRHC